MDWGRLHHLQDSKKEGVAADFFPGTRQIFHDQVGVLVAVGFPRCTMVYCPLANIP